jgi:hypothetical protein
MGESERLGSKTPDRMTTEYGGVCCGVQSPSAVPRWTDELTMGPTNQCHEHHQRVRLAGGPGASAPTIENGLVVARKREAGRAE